MGGLVPLALIIFMCTTCGLAATGLDSEKVSQKLASRLRNGEEVDIFVKMASGISNILQYVTQNRYESREQRLNSIHDLLFKNAERTQKNIIEFLKVRSKSENVQFKSYWINNSIYVKKANAALVEKLISTFDHEIRSVHANEVVAHISTPIDVQAVPAAQIKDDLHWGFRRIDLLQAWEKLGYRTGEEGRSDMPEVKIATIDSGVRRSHEALRDNYADDGYGWWDPIFGSTYPDDRAGHGTHTTATIVGSHGCGVAPWAKWMSCRGCPNLGCTEEGLVSCGQWLACPTKIDGSSADCSKAPRLISNSWSAGAGSTWFDEVLKTWTAAGIIPVFSIGNFGNAFCSSAFYPGDQPHTLGVGSTTINDDLSWFSSIGPTKYNGNLLKPDVVAPGSDIPSASHIADNEYTLMSGTSMSCPHVSGIITMLLTQNPNLTFEEARTAIVGTTAKGLRSRNLTCLGVPDTAYPNYVYGFGLVNALKSLRSFE